MKLSKISNLGSVSFLLFTLAQGMKISASNVTEPGLFIQDSNNSGSNGAGPKQGGKTLEQCTEQLKTCNQSRKTLKIQYDACLLDYSVETKDLEICEIQKAYEEHALLKLENDMDEMILENRKRSTNKIQICFDILTADHAAAPSKGYFDFTYVLNNHHQIQDPSTRSNWLGTSTITITGEDAANARKSVCQMTDYIFDRENPDGFFPFVEKVFVQAYTSDSWFIQVNTSLKLWIDSEKLVSSSLKSKYQHYTYQQFWQYEGKRSFWLDGTDRHTSGCLNGKKCMLKMYL